MALIKGTVTRTILDWYAAQAQSAQQWFSQATASYWAFTLYNNATDGSLLRVYDARAVSGAAFPVGTGNPIGNPSAFAGYQGAQVPTASWSLVNERPTTVNGASSITAVSPGSIVAGNLLLAYISSANIAASTVSAPDSTWTRLVALNGASNYPMLTLWGKIATASEPGSYTFTLSGSPSVAIDADIFQFSGNNSPGYTDNSGTNSSGTASKNVVAPAVLASVSGDLVFCVWAAPSAAAAFGTVAGFTMGTNYAGYTNRWRAGWMALGAQGTYGPYLNTITNAEGWSALSVTLQAAIAGGGPAQYLSAPIQSISPLQPGIFSAQFSSSAIVLPGLRVWLPPTCNFNWQREAPIAVVNPGVSFSLAGIAPEDAAWASMSWIPQK